MTDELRGEARRTAIALGEVSGAHDEVPPERVADVRATAALLRDALRHEDVLALDDLRRARILAAASDERPRRRRAWWAVAAAVVLALASVGTWRLVIVPEQQRIVVEQRAAERLAAEREREAHRIAEELQREIARAKAEAELAAAAAKAAAEQETGSRARPDLQGGGGAPTHARPAKAATSRSGGGAGACEANDPLCGL